MLAELGPDVVLEPAAGDVRVRWHEASAAVQSLEAGEGVGPSGERSDDDAAAILDVERRRSASSVVDDAERRQVAF